MHNMLRLAQLLSMVVWVGGLVFFAFVMAPVTFHVLPSARDAGMLVGGALRVFDWVALGCGTAFIAATTTMFHRAAFRVRGRYEMELLLAGLMVLGTAYIQWNVLPAMDGDRRLAGGDVLLAAASSPERVHFNKLHARSERIEGVVMLLGVAVVFLMSRELSTARETGSVGGIRAPTTTSTCPDADLIQRRTSSTA